MKRLIAVVALSVVSLATLGAMAPVTSTITGYISDAKCATAGAKAQTAAEWIQPAAFESCVQQCVKDGSRAVFVTENNKMLTLDTASVEKITPYLGHKVRVTGTVNRSILKIDGITGLKIP